MLMNEKLDTYRKMKLWINEIPENVDNSVAYKVCEYAASENIHWFNGELCLELRIAPRAASNYAMLNLIFKECQSSKFQVVYKYCCSNEIVQSDIAMPNDVVKTGIVREYQKTLQQIFDELSLQCLFPSGTLEIIGGRYGTIGSSDVAVEVVLKILIKLFELGNRFETSDINSIILKGCKEKM